jgi:hypothetical protein
MYIADNGRFNVMMIMLVFSAAVVLGLWIPGRNSSASIAFAFSFGLVPEPALV